MMYFSINPSYWDFWGPTPNPNNRTWITHQPEKRGPNIWCLSSKAFQDMGGFIYSCPQSNMMSQLREGESMEHWVRKMWSTGAKAICHYHQRHVSPPVDSPSPPPAKRALCMIAQHTLFISFWLSCQEDHPQTVARCSPTEVIITSVLRPP